MKPQHLNIIKNENQSFSVRKDFYPNINNRWHYHKQLELVHFHKGAGTQFVDDNIQKFGPGDIVLIGSDLPHYWKYDELSAMPNDEQPYSTVIHFFDNFLGDRFLALPEAANFRSLFESAKRGIIIRREKSSEIAKHIENIHETEGIIRIISMLECLDAISNFSNLELLSTVGFRQDSKESEEDRMNEIQNFVLNNFKRKIELKHVAAVAGISVTSFCRYFKSRTGKTFIRYLADVRIGYACKLTLDNCTNMKNICHESGFNNFSCFNRTFKLVTGRTPKEYKVQHRIK